MTTPVFNKIAVVLRGHPRTWHYINRHVFKEFSNISKSVDYYFVTWYSPNLDTNKIIKSFQGQSLKKFVHILPNQYSNGTEGPSYLASHVLEDVMAENYDVVIDTRPDIITFMTSDFQPTLDNNTVITAWNNVPHPHLKRLQMDDLFQIMKPEVFKVFCNLYKIPLPFTSNPHADLRDRYMLSQIKFVIIDHNTALDPGFGNSLVVRPTNLEQILKEDFNRWTIGHEEWWKLFQLGHNWRELSSEEKREKILKYSNILPEDYEI